MAPHSFCAEHVAKEQSIVVRIVLLLAHLIAEQASLVSHEFQWYERQEDYDPPERREE